MCMFHAKIELFFRYVKNGIISAHKSLYTNTLNIYFLLDLQQKKPTLVSYTPSCWKTFKSTSDLISLKNVVAKSLFLVLSLVNVFFFFSLNSCQWLARKAELADENAQIKSFFCRSPFDLLNSDIIFNQLVELVPFGLKYWTHTSIYKRLQLIFKH